MAGLRRTAALAVMLVAAPALLAAAPDAAPGPAVVPAFGHTDAASPLTEVSLWVRAGTDRETGAGGLAALTAEAVLHAPVGAFGTTQTLEQAVAAAGGSAAVDVNVRGVRFSVTAPAAQLPALTALLARALSGDPTAAAIAGARLVLDASITDEDGTPIVAGLQALQNAYYVDGPARPTYGTAASLAGITAADVAAFHRQWYVRGGAFTTVVGQTGDAVAPAVAHLTDALPDATAAADPAVRSRPFGAEARRIVIRRDTASPYVVLGFAAPALGDRDFAATLVVRSLLMRALASRESGPFPALGHAYGVLYGYDIAPAQFAVWLDGARIDPSTGVASVAAILNDAGTEKFSAAAIAQAKSAAAGAWLVGVMGLDERASLMATSVDLGLGSDAASGVPPAIAAVTAVDVQRVARRYFAKFDVALVSPREGTGG